MTPNLPAAFVREFSRAALPLASYYAVTLVMPLANGAAFSDAFGTHAVVVLLVPLAMVGVISAVRSASQKTTRSVTLRRRPCGATTKDTKGTEVWYPR